MCGIIGYIGYRNARNVVLEGLKRLEYRGYDSSGIALIQDKLIVFREVGDIENLEKILPFIECKIAIGHTRWATHGKVCKENAHPHVSCDGKIAVVHNGIIENFKELKEELEKKGHKFLSETDTEVIAHLIEENYNGNLLSAVKNAIKNLRGSYAIVAMAEDEPDKIVGARKENPLIIGMGEKENFIASDIPAFLKYTNRVKYIEDNEICELSVNGVKIFDLNGNEINREEKIVEWSIEEAEKGGFPHYMLKEIYEQPDSLAETMRGRILEIEPWIKLDIDDDIDEITLVACGTSYYACMA
ncbi:MAG: isomerizing glutamine--fructose-6-phosphate transaminase, partial [Thermoplasmata archaeon]|nr:isomerizing glutamine--fructose-6-phosphate transaminase [Thermoplasmata archaeon]